MGTIYTNDHASIDWRRELDEYFDLQPMTITEFIKDKPYKYWAIWERLIKDPRYIRKWKKAEEETFPSESSDTIRLIPVVVEDSCISSLIRINGFDLEITRNTDPSALSTVLKAMREL